MNLEIQIARAPGGPLVQGFLADDPQVCGFYPHRWSDPDSYRSRAWEIAQRPEPASWAEAVTPSGAAARAKLDAVLAGEGFVVTTGQQPGLFGGPLYSLYKALTAARLAEALEGIVGRPVAPLFWVASEDHDWAETNHTYLVGVDNELHRLELPEQEGAGAQPLYRLPVGPSIPPLLERVRALLPDTDVASAAVELMEDAFGSPDATLASGFQDLMARLLEPFGMLFVQAHDRALKAGSIPILESGLDRSRAIEEVLRARAQALEEAGFPVQVPILEDGVNLFMEGPGGRERVYREGDGFRLRHSGLELSADEARARIRREPGTVSPNVLLRPVVEAAFFPTLAYVAGPGELAYYAQLQPLFQELEVGMPVIFPRLGATLVERKIGKVLGKFEVDRSTLARPFHEVASELARDEVPDGVRRALGEIRGALGKGTSALVDAAREVDPTLKGPIQHARSVSMDAFADAERKILQGVKRQNEITLQQLEKAQLHLFPDGKPQERVMGPLYYLARYGTEWIAAVAEAMRIALPPSAPDE